MGPGRPVRRVDSSGRTEISGVWLLEPLEPAVVHYWDVARQLHNGRSTSKLGNEEDIEHDLRALEGPVSGLVSVVMRRPRA